MVSDSVSRKRVDDRRDEVASLLALGMDPAAIAKAIGVPAPDLAGIARDSKERAIRHRTAAKRGQDVRTIITAAASYRQALAADPWAPVPGDLAGLFRPRIEIDAGLAGLDRRLIIAFADQDTRAIEGSAFQVGVEDAWSSVDMLATRHVVPAGAQAAEGWNIQVGWGRATAVVELSVETMAQSINPLSLHLLRGAMDWRLWRLRAEHVVRHEGVIERFDSYRFRAAVESPRRDAAGGVPQVLDHEIASQLVGSGSSMLDRDIAKECHLKRAWAAFVELDRAWREEWLDRLVLLLYDPPGGEDGRRKLDALANMFPVATLYTGGCKTSRGAGKAEHGRAAVVDALVVKSNLTAMTDHVLAVAAAVAPDVVIMPECAALDIPYPSGYPVGDITRVYRPGGGRASAVREGRLCTFEEQWTAQQEVDG